MDEFASATIQLSLQQMIMLAAIVACAISWACMDVEEQRVKETIAERWER